MSLADELIAASTSAMLQHMNKKRKVHFDPGTFKPPSLPRPPAHINTPDDWPVSFRESIDKALDRAGPCYNQDLRTLYKDVPLLLFQTQYSR